MKKIFGLFAMAAVVATSLTCCGGGGGDGGNFAYKTYRFNSPTMAGSMVVRVFEPMGSGAQRYEATISFGDRGIPYNGEFEVMSDIDAENPVVTVHINGNPNFATDEGVFEFFSDFLPPDLEQGDGVYGAPQPLMTLTYTNAQKTMGSYTLQYNFKMAGDDPRTEEEEGENHEYTYTVTYDTPPLPAFSVIE